MKESSSLKPRDKPMDMSMAETKRMHRQAAGRSLYTGAGGCLEIMTRLIANHAPADLRALIPCIGCTALSTQVASKDQDRILLHSAVAESEVRDWQQHRAVIEASSFSQSFYK